MAHHKRGDILAAGEKLFVVWPAGAEFVALPIKGQHKSLHRTDVRLAGFEELREPGFPAAPLVRCAEATPIPSDAVFVERLPVAALSLIETTLRRAAESGATEMRTRLVGRTGH